MRQFRQVVKLLVATLLALGMAPALMAAPAQAAGVITIAEARTLPLGTVVTVLGTVTTSPGSFESSFFDKGFGLQDKSAGIYVSLQNALTTAPGAKALVTGTLKDNFGLLTLVPASGFDVVLDRKVHPVQVKRVGTAGVGETTEGRIVRVRGEITQAPVSDLPYGYKLFVDDGSGKVQIFVNVQTGIDLSGLTVGDQVNVTGFSSQFEDHYEIDPRSQDDIKVVGEER